MDVSINATVQQLLGEDIGQYTKELYGLGERVNDNRNHVNEDDGVGDESDDESLVKDTLCPVCSKTNKSPNEVAKDHIKKCQAALKSSGMGPFLRDNAVSSLVLEDYLRPSIWCWHPERLLSSTPRRPLLCWNKSCSGQLGKSHVYNIPQLILP